MGAAAETLRRGFSQTDPAVQPGSALLSEANLRRLVSRLSKMRGAALKMGQFMSIQGPHRIVTRIGGFRLIYTLDAKTLPPQLESIFSELQRTADYMPAWQSEQVLVRSLGPDWRLPLSRFDVTPIAAASIGQVHSAQLSDGNLEVAVKIQFPGVAQSISSDLGNLKMLLSASAVLPKGLYLDNTIKIMKRELLDECDYAREAESCKRFQTLLADDPVFKVPRVIDNLTSAHVLTTERMFGTSLSRSKHLSQPERDLVDSHGSCHRWPLID